MVGIWLTHRSSPGKHSSTITLPTSALLVVQTVKPCPILVPALPLAFSDAFPSPHRSAGRRMMISGRKSGLISAYSAGLRNCSEGVSLGVGRTEEDRWRRYSRAYLSSCGCERRRVYSHLKRISVTDGEPKTSGLDLPGGDKGDCGGPP